ncbi:hypothetical protein IFVP177_C2150030 [Vibrio parahaemolyticus]|nr:hypothetical protein Vp2S01_A0099 [Vibrio parahaemolyticus]EFO42358.1 conserved hypothetical protein [Vibrio parahaemolyticus AN-5034]EFO49604.1 conserved hypothetical protein [Vibrio parahaemolyticus K5030]EQL90610.1 hypothetical protein D035_4387 [Vibrio parahaemolyticus VP250]EQM43639.1 hypothetical protein D042_3407 [Vibrio parahaemolyticus NIHCB0757]EXJ37540.1 hypothetical protein D050_0029 [Vibrio parahaemolyticus VPCR-2009]
MVSLCRQLIIARLAARKERQSHLSILHRVNVILLFVYILNG